MICEIAKYPLDVDKDDNVFEKILQYILTWVFTIVTEDRAIILAWGVVNYVNYGNEMIHLFIIAKLLGVEL